MVGRSDIERQHERLERIMALRGITRSGWSRAANLSKNMLKNYYDAGGMLGLKSARGLAQAANVPVDALTLEMDDDQFSAWIAAETERLETLKMLGNRAAALGVSPQSFADELGIPQEDAARMLGGFLPISREQAGVLSYLVKMNPNVLAEQLGLPDRPHTPPSERVEPAPPAIDPVVLAEVIDAVRTIESDMGMPLDKESRSRLIAETYKHLSSRSATGRRD